MNYHNITKDDMLNGDGLRVVLWVAGCTHHCQGCQNPITWDVGGGIPFDDAAEKELFEALNRPHVSGITFSGGDPLHPFNREEVFRLIKKIRTELPQKTIWLYTGYTFEQCVLEPGGDLPTHNVLKLNRQCIVERCDVLVDGEYIEKQRDITLKWRGSKNQRVINIPETLKQNKVVLYCD